eukprot:11146222-Ditylum_brightwellii.AAC.1
MFLSISSGVKFVNALYVIFPALYRAVLRFKNAAHSATQKVWKDFWSCGSLSGQKSQNHAAGWLFIFKPWQEIKLGHGLPSI